jgi:DNA-binding MarR family transcriptional regulator
MMIEPAKVFTDLVIEVFRLNGRLLAAGDRIAAPVGLTSARWQVLGAIAEQPLTVSQIARAMGLTRQSVQRLADALAGEGVVAYAPNPQHRRAKLVEPTPAGRAMLERIGAIQRDWARHVSNGIPAARLADAVDLLNLLRRRLEAEEDATIEDGVEE